MKKVYVILSIFLVIVISIVGVRFYIKFGGKGYKSKLETKKERRVLFYRHPMDPSITSPTSQKDEMGMDYIPIYEEETAGDEIVGTVRISPEKIQRIGVKIEEAKIRNLKHTIRTVGRVEHDESRLFTVNTKIGGWIEKLYVNKTDQMVQKGEKLLEIYSPELISAQEEYLIALKTKEALNDKGMEPLLDAVRQRLKYWDITDEQIGALEREKKLTRTMTLYAPAQGIVIEKMANLGMKIEQGETLFKIIDHSNVWVYGEIYEHELPFLRIGDKARVVPSNLDNKVYTANVSHIYSHFGTVRYEDKNMAEEVRTAKIRFDLPNPEHRLKLGQFVTIELSVDVAKGAVSVPESALIDTGARQTVFVNIGDGRFEPRDVKVGASADGYYQILSGIKAGEKIVTSANFLIDSESSFRAAIQGMTGK